MNRRLMIGMGALMVGMIYGCTVKAVGDPQRPITIRAHVTVDIRGLEQTARSLEDYVAQSEDATQQPSSNTQ